MMKIYTLLFIAVALLFCRCKSIDSSEVISLKSFVGSWSQELDSTVTIQFTEDGYYYDSRYNKHSDDFKISVGQLDGTIKEQDFGRLIYKVISKEKDIVIVSIIGENNGEEFRRKGYIFDNEINTFIEIVYKMGKGIDNHIQYAERFVKNGHTIADHIVHLDSLVLVIPNHFNKDHIFLAFDQDINDNGVTRILEDRKVYVSEEGTNRISLKEDMNLLLNGAVSSYLDNGKTAHVPLYTLQANEWKLLLEKSKKVGIEKTLYPIPIDSMVIFSSCRFNPDRNYINKKFKEKVSGNVLAFRYSTIKQELSYLGIRLNSN